MNISALTIVGMIAVITGNGLTYLLNRGNITWSKGLLLGIVTLSGLFMVGHSNHDLNKDIGQLQTEAEALRGRVAELSKPAVEFVKGIQQFFPKDSVWHTIYNFRTNPALHARDIAVTITCNNAIFDAQCLRMSDKPGIGSSSIVPVSWVEKPVSVKFEVNFLAADETLQVTVLSMEQLSDPICDIRTWSRSLPASLSLRS